MPRSPRFQLIREICAMVRYSTRRATEANHCASGPLKSWREIARRVMGLPMPP